MKQSCIFIISWLAAAICLGQEMTLQECVRTGIANNLSLADARISVSKGRTGVAQHRARLLPTVNGTLQLTDYLKKPVNVTTGTLLGNDFPSDPTWQAVRSMRHHAGTGIGLSMPLYDQTLLEAVNVARTMERMSELSYEKAVEELTMQIGKVYYMAQASREQGRLADENIGRMAELCNITEALFGQGVVMEVDLNRARINLQTLKTQRDQTRMLYEQQLNMLRFLMNMAPETPLEVTRMAEDVEPQPASGISEELPELRLAAQERHLAEQRIKTVKAGYLPAVSLTGYAGTSGYQERFHQFFHTNTATHNWFGNCYIGLSVKVPLFEANSKKLQLRQYRNDVARAANRMVLIRKQLDEHHADAMLQLEHNMKVFRTQTENRRQAEEVLGVTEEQYKEGVASMTTLLQDEMQLRTAQSACVQALCQFLLARLDLLRFSGNLSQLSEQ